MAMQMPRTRVGKISAQRMLGIGPNPMTYTQQESTTLTVEIAECITLPIFTKPPMTKMKRHNARSGTVMSSNLLQKEVARNHSKKMRRDQTTEGNILNQQVNVKLLCNFTLK